MILLRQDSQKQNLNNPHSLKSTQFISKHHITNQNSQCFDIFPCCYQLSLHKINNPSQLQESIHFCMPNKEYSTAQRPLSFRIQQNPKEFNQNNFLNLQKQLIQCSLCLKSSITDNSQFYNCLHCKKQFCLKCTSQVHSKGKFHSHQVIKITQNQSEFHQTQNLFTCQTHQKPRKNIIRNRIVCEICYKQESGKFPIQQNQSNEQWNLVQENIAFTLEYFNEIYHNQANKLSDVKQTLTKTYNNYLQRIQQKYKSSLSQIQKLQTTLKTTLTQTLTQLTNMTTQIKSISLQCILNSIPKQLLSTRINFIREKKLYIQQRCEQYISEISYDYKIGDKDRNQTMIEQLLKCISIVKTKRQQDEAMYTNRNSFRNNLKTSRTVSRPSSFRLNSSKDNRCLSFKKQQNMSSSKQNSSFKDKDRNLMMKNQLNTNVNRNNGAEISRNNGGDINRNNGDLAKSVTGMKSMGKSVSRTSSNQQSVISSRNNSLFFSQHQQKYDMKELQKAEHQDLNINLKKIIGSKRVVQPSKKDPQSRKLIKQQQKCKNSQNLLAESQSTSLQKNDKENETRRNYLIKQNEKSSIGSGSFLKVFEQKSKSIGRKNYLLSSAELLLEQDGRHKGQVEGRNKGQFQACTINRSSINNKQSPQMCQQQKKKKNIKQQIFGSNKTSSSQKSQLNNYSQFTSNSPSIINSNKSKNESNEKHSQQKSKENHQYKDSHERQVHKEMGHSSVTVSCQKNAQNNVSEFDRMTGENYYTNSNLCEMTKSLVADFSYSLVRQHPQQIQLSLKSPQLNLNANNTQTIDSSKHHKTSDITKTNKSRPKLDNSVFKDSTNTLKANQKTTTQKTSINDKNNKKKPDFMDMRQKMKKPNYLSTRLNTNLNAAHPLNKITDNKK